jgi:hypothetical protein
MAQTIADIQQQILTAKATALELNALEILTTSEIDLSNANSTSKVTIWRLWVWIWAFVFQIHERIVEKNAENSRPHTIRWYREQCLSFLDGLPLVWKDEQFKYDLTNVSDAENRKIIDRCAVLESENGQLVIKIATFTQTTNGILQPVTPQQLVRFAAYIGQIKDAGNRIRIINENGDLLKIDLTVYVDPLIIDLQTGQLLSTNEAVFPVKNAVKDYLQHLEFNGALVRTFLQDSLQKAMGVKLPIINSIASQFSGFPFQNITEIKVPESGYFNINDADLTINYLQYDISNG